jgi:hypothetical protein
LFDGRIISLYKVNTAGEKDLERTAEAPVLTNDRQL